MIFRLFSINQLTNRRGVLALPYTHLLPLTVWLLTMFAGCGHKQHSVLFAPVAITRHVSKLMFPAPRNVITRSTDYGNRISWQPVDIPDNTSLLGYSIYRITRKNCIPRKPLNAKPTPITTFLDDKKCYKHARYYILHAVFKKDEIIINGPLSCMVKIVH